MNKKLQKITLLVASLAILVACIFTVTALATDTGSAEPALEISKRNLIYYDDIGIMFAARAENVGENPDLQLNCYVKTEDGEKIVTVTDYKINTTIDDGVTYYVFETPGISLAHLADEVIVQLVATVDGEDYYSELSRFSVVEYNYKRLYYDACGYDAQVPEVKDYQEALYNHVIGMGTNLQIATGVNTDDTPAHYYYVNAKGAAVETITRGDYTAALDTATMKAGESFTLEYAGELSAGQYVEWTVNYTTNDGTKTTETVADGTTITIEDKHVVAVPEVKLYINDYEGDNPTADYTINSVYGSPYFDAIVVEDPDPAYDGDKALAIKQLYASSNKTPNTVSIPVEGNTGNCYVFTADVRWQMTVTKVDGSGTTSTATGAIVKHHFVDSSNSASVTTNLEYSKQASGTSAINSMLFSNSNNESLTGYMYFDTWYTVRIELYNTGSGYITRYYINDLFVAEDDCYTSTSDIAALRIDTTNNNGNVYYDNLSFVRINQDYVAIDDEIDGTASGTGVYFNSEAAGTRYDFTDFTRYDSTNEKVNYRLNYAPLLGNAGLVGTNRIADTYRLAYDDGYGLYRKELDEGETSNHIHMYYDLTAAESATAYTVVEMDFAFGGIADKDNFFELVVNNAAASHKATLYFAGTTEGKATISMSAHGSNSVTFGTAPVFEANKWYNLRVEYHLDNTIKIFVDGDHVCTVKAVDTGTSTNSRIDFKLNTNSSTEWIAYDNLFMGYVEPVTE